MIKHIVFWRFKETADGRSRFENLRIAKEMIEGMMGIIPGLKHIEAGINFSSSEKAFDLILYSEFETKEDLEVYRDHPAHQPVKDFISQVRSEGGVVDYEV